jgi:DNA-binding response OmpR family regulator
MPLQTPRILIVEDEPMLAYALEECLQEAGFTVVGVAARLGQALEIIDTGTPDAAILDTNLAGVSASPVAAALAARGLPFIVLSGYLPSQQPEGFSRGLHLQKPCRLDRLTAALHGLLADAEG